VGLSATHASNHIMTSTFSKIVMQSSFHGNAECVQCGV